MQLTEIVSRVDPKKIERYFPSRQMKDKFEAAKESVNGVLSDAENGQVSPEFIVQIELSGEKMIELYQELADKTELGSKARLNESVFWAEAGHVERSIFLAGIARERKLRDPYRTQLSILPAHACLFRFGQVSKIDNWIRENSKIRGNEEVAIELAYMKSSYLYQLNYFATDAYTENKTHPFAAYLKIIATLLMAQETRMNGRDNAAKEFENIADTICTNISEPAHDSHYMHLNYHKKNYEEFSQFQHLSESYPLIASRLRTCCEKAIHIEKEGGGKKPRDYFDFIPYVTYGARAASVLSIVCLAPAVLELI